MWHVSVLSLLSISLPFTRSLVRPLAPCLSCSESRRRVSHSVPVLPFDRLAVGPRRRRRQQVEARRHRSHRHVRRQKAVGRHVRRQERVRRRHRYVRRRGVDGHLCTQSVRQISADGANALQVQRQTLASGSTLAGPPSARQQTMVERTSGCSATTADNVGMVRDPSLRRAAAGVKAPRARRGDRGCVDALLSLIHI